MRHKTLLKETIKHIKHDQDFRDCLIDWLVAGPGEKYLPNDFEEVNR